MISYILPLLITPFEWFVIIALAVVIAAAVAVIINALRNWGGAGNPPPPPAAGTAAQNMTNLIASLAAERRSPSEQECADLRRWHNEAVSGGISTDVTGPALRAINRLCPGS